MGRAIAGAGAAGISSGVYIIAAFSAPVDKRPVFIGMMGAFYGIASATGPLIGGALTSNASWRWWSVSTSRSNPSPISQPLTQPQFLHQPSHRWSSNGRNSAMFPSPQKIPTYLCHLERKAHALEPRQRHPNHGSSCVLPSSDAMGWTKQALEPP